MRSDSESHGREEPLGSLFNCGWLRVGDFAPCSRRAWLARLRAHGDGARRRFVEQPAVDPNVACIEPTRGSQLRQHAARGQYEMCTPLPAALAARSAFASSAFSAMRSASVNAEQSRAERLPSAWRRQSSLQR